MTRLKKILKWTGIALGCLVAIGLVANAWFVWTTDTRLEEQLAEIRAAGDPLTLADLARAPIPPEKNADTYLRRAEADCAAIDSKISVCEVMTLINAGRSPLPMPQAVQKTIREAFEACPTAIPLLKQAAACPDYVPQWDYSLPEGEFIAKMLPAMSTLRTDARVLQYRAWLLSAEGKRDEAVRTGITLLRLARHVEGNSLAICYLVAITVRGIAVDCINCALQSGGVSGSIRAELDSELGLHERTAGLVLALKSDRALIMGMLDVPWFIPRALQNRWKSEYLDAVQAFLVVLQAPLPFDRSEQLLRSSIVDEKCLSSQKFAPHFQLTAQEAISLLNAETHKQAAIRSLRILNALQTRVPPGSKEPPKLSDLGLPPETTTDPFTGEPLKIKKTPRGWLAYSVGRNFTDDGGKVDDRDADVGVGPPPEAKTDEK